jgi:hypothetical protein
LAEDDKKVNPRSSKLDELSEHELDLMDKLLSNPRLWPDTAKVWIADYVSQNSLLPIGQVQGSQALQDDIQTALDQLSALSQIEYEYVSAEVTTTSTTYVTLSGGPDVPSLDDGTYLALAIAYAGNTTAEVGASRFAIHLNGSQTGVSGVEGVSFRNDSLKDNISIAAVVTASAGAGANTIDVRYKKSDAAGTARFESRFLIVMRVA